MPLYSFAPPSGLGSPATPQTGPLSALLDVLIDPVTLDYIDTADGGFAETADSRTAVTCMFEIRLGRSYSAPGDGTRILDLLESGELTTGQVKAEYTRAARVLEDASMIAQYSIRVEDENKRPLRDAAGRFAPEHRWIDLASGSQVDYAFGPQGA